MKYSEEELIDECIAGNALAQEQLFKRFSRKMLGVCLRYAQCEEEAEDIFQEAFIKVFRNLHSFRRECPLEAWIRRIMVNTALKFIRKNHNQKETASLDEVLEIPDEGVEHVTDKLDREDMLKMVESLPDGYRMVFNLYAFEGYSHKEIADQLGISENTSKSQLSRARKHLQNLLLKSNYFEISEHERPTK